MKTRTMKKLVLLLTSLIMSCSFAFSCGTVEGWHQYYFEHKGNLQEQLYALYYLQCEPVLKDTYKHTFAQDTLLLNLIEDAFKKGLESGNDCFTVTAIKIFYLFDELKTLKDKKGYSTRHSDLKLKIGELIPLPIKNFAAFKVSYFSYLPEKEYCEKIKQELDWVK